MKNELIEGYYFPLHNLDWDGKTFTINSNVKIIPRDLIVPSIAEMLNLNGEIIENKLGEIDLNNIISASHWLFVDSSLSKADAENLVSLFLLSLWLEINTKAYIRYQFYIFNKIVSSYYRWTSWYEFNSENKFRKLAGKDLINILSIFTKTQNIYSNKDGMKRIREALYLTHLACKSKPWQQAYMLWMGSLETLLFEPPEKKGITYTICSRYARMVSQNKIEYDSNYLIMQDIYDIRSDIIHGKFGGRDWDSSSKERLDQLSKLENIAKLVWKNILAINNLEDKLEKVSDRDIFFNQTLQRF